MELVVPVATTTTTANIEEEKEARIREEENEIIISNDTMEGLTTEFSELSNGENGGGGSGGGNNNYETYHAVVDTTAAAATDDTTSNVHNKKSKRISEFDAVQHLIKGNLGPGCLNIPHAFAAAGWVLGLFLFALVAIQGIYSMVLLVYCKQWIRSDRRSKNNHQQIRQLGEEAAEGGETTATTTSVATTVSTTSTTTTMDDSTTTQEEKEILTFMDVAHASHGTAGAVTIQVLLFVMQAGVCCVFLDLISTNLHAAVPSFLPFEGCVGLVTFLLLIVVLVPDLKELRWLSLGANCLMTTAVATASVSALFVLLGPPSDGGQAEDDDHDGGNKARRWTNNPAAIAAFVSSMFYAFEGIGLVMPIESSFVGYGTGEEEEEDSSGPPSRRGGRGSRGGHNGDYESPSAQESHLENGNNHHEGTVHNNGAGEEEDPSERRRADRVRAFINPVLPGAMGTVALLFLVIGMTCGPAFPDIVDGSVTAYLTTKHPDNTWYQVVNAGVMVAVFLTFPLQLTPAMEVLGDWFAPGCDPVCCNRSGGSGSGMCCRAPPEGGRHTPFRQQRDDIGNGHHHRGPGEVGGRRSDDAFEDEPTTPVRNPSCFGNHEWIFRRYMVVFGCAVVVLTVNDLALLMSLIGALGNTGLAAMPCLVHWKLMQKGIAPPNVFLKAVDVATMTFSLGVAVVGVSFSVRELLLEHQQR